MKFVLSLLVFFMAAGTFAEPTDILVYHEVQSGYGTAVIDAINILWPSVNLSAHTGGEAGMLAFNAELGAQNWDIIITECWYYDTDDLYWPGINDLYDTGAAAIYASCWEWNGGTSNQIGLANAMGVTGVSEISGGVIPHYAWEPTHPICDGISDWSWADPGLGVLNARFTVSDATPVTGWTSSPTSGEAGICVANDGISVISGFTAGYAIEDVAIWTNILEFMAGEPGSLESTTWGDIKTNF